MLKYKLYKNKKFYIVFHNNRMQEMNKMNEYNFIKIYILNFFNFCKTL